MSARIGVVVFPGTNCEADVVEAVGVAGGDAELLWHAERDLRGADAVVLPGGFAHGDYLRVGALARFSPVMDAVVEHARGGGTVVGICNGFQVLCEAGLLPGALVENAGRTFVCRMGHVRVETSSSALTAGVPPGTELRLPLNHFSGRYVCEPHVLEQLRAEDRVVLRYVDDPNGAVDAIAGVCSPGGHVVGLMPHPERACLDLLGSADGLVLLRALLASTSAPAPRQ